MLYVSNSIIIAKFRLHYIICSIIQRILVVIIMGDLSRNKVEKRLTTRRNSSSEQSVFRIGFFTNPKSIYNYYDVRCRAFHVLAGTLLHTFRNVQGYLCCSDLCKYVIL